MERAGAARYSRFDMLSDGLLLKVFECTLQQDLFVIARVCRRFNLLLASDTTKLWNEVKYGPSRTLASEQQLSSFLLWVRARKRSVFQLTLEVERGAVAVGICSQLLALQHLKVQTTGATTDMQILICTLMILPELKSLHIGTTDHRFADVMALRQFSCLTGLQSLCIASDVLLTDAHDDTLPQLQALRELKLSIITWSSIAHVSTLLDLEFLCLSGENMESGTIVNHVLSKCLLPLGRLTRLQLEDFYDVERVGLSSRCHPMLASLRCRCMHSLTSFAALSTDVNATLGCQAVSTAATLWDPLPEVVELRFDYMRLEMLQSACGHLTSLTSVTLLAGNLSTIPLCVFKLSNLRSLALEAFSKLEVDMVALQSMAKLESLRMISCPIFSISGSLFNLAQMRPGLSVDLSGSIMAPSGAILY